MEETLERLRELFTQVETPEEIAQDLVQLLFNYASLVDEETLPLFKKDVGTIYMLYNGLIEKP